MLRARFSPLPTEAPWVELDDSSPSISGAVPGSRGSHARLPLGVRGNWVAIPDRHDPSTATLLVLLGSEDQASLDAVLEDARKRVADRVRSLGLSAAPVAGGTGPGAHAGPADPQGPSSGWGPSAGSSGPSTGWGPSTGSHGPSSGWGPSAGSAGSTGSAGPTGSPETGATGNPPSWGSSGPRQQPPQSPWGRS